jgi:PTS system fructose-specific IIA component/PTS system nitrogen regulatory IIA component
MKFSDFIVMPAIKAELAADEKRDVIEELVHSLATAGVIKPADEAGIVAAVMRREELGSTGIGRGVAVPHTKHPSVERLIGTVGISSEGVNFNSLDGAKVHLFFLIVSPHDRPSDHLRALEQITMHLRDDAFCRFLKQAGSVTDIQQLLEEADGNQFSP